MRPVRRTRRARSTLLAVLAAATLAAGCTEDRTENVQAASNPTGAGCADNTQCTSGFCARPAGLLCGWCRPAPKVGDSCLTIGCADGQLCVSGYSTCAMASTQGQPCNRRQPCADHLSCVGASVIGTARTGTCQPAIDRVGDACDPDKQDGPACDSVNGLHCHRQRRVCEAIAIVDQPGGACGPIGPSVAKCGSRLSCVRGRCVPVAGVDQPCNRGTGPVCEAPAVCVSDHVYGGSSGFCRLPGDQSCAR
jgi:hypothetical protein